MMKLLNYFKRRSIKVKLTSVFTLLLCVFCSIAALLVENDYNRNFSQREDILIDKKLEKLHAIIDDRSDFIEVIRQDLEWGSLYTSSPEVLTRIINSSGQMVLESEGMGNIAPAGMFPALLPNGTYGEDTVVSAPDNRSFLLRSDSDWSRTPDKRVTIQLALDITADKAIDAANHRNIL